MGLGTYFGASFAIYLLCIVLTIVALANLENWAISTFTNDVSLTTSSGFTCVYQFSVESYADLNSFTSTFSIDPGNCPPADLPTIDGEPDSVALGCTTGESCDSLDSAQKCALAAVVVSIILTLFVLWPISQTMPCCCYRTVPLGSLKVSSVLIAMLSFVFMVLTFNACAQYETYTDVTIVDDSIEVTLGYQWGLELLAGLLASFPFLFQCYFLYRLFTLPSSGGNIFGTEVGSKEPAVTAGSVNSSA